MWMIAPVIGLGIGLALVALYLLSCIRILNEYQRGVIFRLGRAMPKPKGPGLIMVFSPVDSMIRVDLRTITRVIEPQDIITRDNVSVRVNAVLYFRVVDPMRSVLEVADFLFATSQVALTTLRSTLGQAELDDLLPVGIRSRRLFCVFGGAAPLQPTGGYDGKAKSERGSCDNACQMSAMRREYAFQGRQVPALRAGN